MIPRSKRTANFKGPDRPSSRCIRRSEPVTQVKSRWFGSLLSVHRFRCPPRVRERRWGDAAAARGRRNRRQLIAREKGTAADVVSAVEKSSRLPFVSPLFAALIGYSNPETEKNRLLCYGARRDPRCDPSVDDVVSESALLSSWYPRHHALLTRTASAFNKK